MAEYAAGGQTCLAPSGPVARGRKQNRPPEEAASQKLPRRGQLDHRQARRMGQVSKIKTSSNPTGQLQADRVYGFDRHVR